MCIICSRRLLKAVSEVVVWLDVENVLVYSGKYSKQVYTISTVTVSCGQDRLLAEVL